jgi:hypothetical protein
LSRQHHKTLLICQTSFFSWHVTGRHILSFRAFEAYPWFFVEPFRQKSTARFRCPAAIDTTESLLILNLGLAPKMRKDPHVDGLFDQGKPINSSHIGSIVYSTNNS